MADFCVGMRVEPSHEFRRQFPNSTATTGVVVSTTTRRYPDCWNVKWDQYKMPQRLHRDFIKPATLNNFDVTPKH